MSILILQINRVSIGFVFQITQLHKLRFKLHGLPVKHLGTDFILHHTDLQKFIEFLYKRVKKNSCSTIDVKNDKLIKFLEGSGIPIFDFTKENIGSTKCPALSVFEDYKSHFCHIHSQLVNGSQYRCALNKSLSIRGWLKSKFMITDIDLQYKFSPEKSTSPKDFPFEGDTVF